jgi:hypothetical protein
VVVQDEKGKKQIPLLLPRLLGVVVVSLFSLLLPELLILVTPNVKENKKAR